MVGIPRDQRAPKGQRRAGNESVTEGYLSYLPKLDCLFQNVLRQRQDRGDRKNASKCCRSCSVRW